jgi:pyruvate-formate lyase-activating enzyme
MCPRWFSVAFGVSRTAVSRFVFSTDSCKFVCVHCQNCVLVDLTVSHHELHLHQFMSKSTMFKIVQKCAYDSFLFHLLMQVVL